MLDLLATLWTAGHAAYVVGGSLRDVLLERRPDDWDMASNAEPERVIELFQGAVYENRFGTVAVRRDGEVFEITTFRTDHDYADFRRPHRVEFGDTIELDLRAATSRSTPWPGARAPGEKPTLVDPYGGRSDAAGRLLRAVGDPSARFEEDALRMVRAIRLATTLGFAVEAATLAAVEEKATLVAHLSGERIAAELDKLLAATTPSAGLRLLSETGVLASISPELAAQRGVPQNKVPGEDLWDHTVRSVDAAPAARPVVRLAALLHDIGKPATFADGRFMGHDAVGADSCRRLPRPASIAAAVRDRVVELVRQHMFSYESSWSDAAVRRFIGKMAAIGDGALDELLDLRDGRQRRVGAAGRRGPAGRAPGPGGRRASRRPRPGSGRAGDDGTDLIDALGLTPGPRLGRILEGRSSASSRIRRSTSDRRSCSSPGRRWPRSADRAGPESTADGPHAMVRP